MISTVRYDYNTPQKMYVAHGSHGNVLSQNIPHNKNDIIFHPDFDLEGFQSGFQGSYEADLALIVINLEGLKIKNEVIARPPFDFYLARKSNF